jgi:hypothetical protein
MPRKVKPKIWKWDILKCYVADSMRERAIGLMLRDIWVAAVRELAEEMTRTGFAARLEALMDEVPLEPDEVEEILRQAEIEPKAATDRMMARIANVIPEIPARTPPVDPDLLDAGEEPKR